MSKQLGPVAKTVEAGMQKLREVDERHRKEEAMKKEAERIAQEEVEEVIINYILNRNILGEHTGDLIDENVLVFDWDCPRPVPRPTVEIPGMAPIAIPIATSRTEGKLKAQKMNYPFIIPTQNLDGWNWVDVYNSSEDIEIAFALADQYGSELSTPDKGEDIDEYVMKERTVE